MNGSHLVKISRRRGTKYTFTIKRNITIVRGDSGTGKTTLFDMVADYMRTGEQSGVSLQCDCPCVALTDYDWRNQLSTDWLIPGSVYSWRSAAAAPQKLDTPGTTS